MTHSDPNTIHRPLKYILNSPEWLGNSDMIEVRTQ